MSLGAESHLPRLYVLTYPREAFVGCNMVVEPAFPWFLRAEELCSRIIDMLWYVLNLALIR